MADARRKQMEALKKALASILQEENPLPPHEQEARESELSRRLSSASSLDSPSPSEALHSHDLSIISRLLSQVQYLMEGENEQELLIPPKDVQKSDFHDYHVGTGKNMVEAVVEIASAAAEAAKAAAASSGKNLEVMETFLSNPEKNVRSSVKHDDEEGCASAVGDDESSRQPIVDKDVVKRLERQNRITHWALGFMIVATAVWRFKMVSMILGVRESFSNPFQAFSDMVSDGFKGANKEAQNGAENGFQRARIVLPSIFSGEEKEISKKTEKTEHSTEDFKMGEAFTLSLENLLSSAGMSDNCTSKDTPEEGSSPK